MKHVQPGQDAASHKSHNEILVLVSFDKVYSDSLRMEYGSTRCSRLSCRRRRQRRRKKMKRKKKKKQDKDELSSWRLSRWRKKKAKKTTKIKKKARKKLLVGDGNKSSCVLAVLRLVGKKVLEDQGILILILPLANITVLSCFPDQG